MFEGVQIFEDTCPDQYVNTLQNGRVIVHSTDVYNCNEFTVQILLELSQLRIPVTTSQC